MKFAVVVQTLIFLSNLRFIKSVNEIDLKLLSDETNNQAFDYISTFPTMSPTNYVNDMPVDSTFEPTINPSINPTFYPTFIVYDEPTIYPTISLSNHVTIDPKPKPKPTPHLPNDDNDNENFQSKSLINKKLVPSDGFYYERFGHQVVVDPVTGTVAVSTNYISKQTGGTIYIYKPILGTDNSTLYQEYGKVIVPYTSHSSQFDSFLSIYNDRLLVGVPLDNTQIVAGGVVYTYLLKESTYPTGYPNEYPSIYPTVAPSYSPTKKPSSYLSYSQAIYLPYKQLHEKFGTCVCTFETIAAIGAPGHDYNGIIESGAVYIYKNVYDSYQYVEAIYPLYPSPFGSFGQTIYLTNDWLVVGEPGDSTNDVLGGSVSIYSIDLTPNITATYLSTLTPSILTSHSYFGRSIYLSNDILVISSSQSDGSGLVYVYKYKDSLWLEIARLTSISSSYYDRFGDSLTIQKVDNHDIIAVGCPGDYVDDEEMGSIQLFVNINSKWNFAGRIISNTSDDFASYGSTIASYLSTYLFIGSELSSGSSDKSGVVYIADISTYLSNYFMSDLNDDEKDENSMSLGINIPRAIFAFIFAILPVVLLFSFITYRVVKLQQTRKKLLNEKSNEKTHKKTKKLKGSRKQPFSLMLNDEVDSSIDRTINSDMNKSIDKEVNHEVEIGIDSNDIYQSPKQNQQDMYIDI